MATLTGGVVVATNETRVARVRDLLVQKSRLTADGERCVERFRRPVFTAADELAGGSGGSGQ